jgi:HD-GYP domain-containing protein (c-di-GMP phosphodiesterase class II)
MGLSDTEEEAAVPKKEWKPEELVPQELREAIYDKALPPEKKAKVVYSSSVDIMQKLLEDPKAENIGEVKKGIAEMANLIMSDDQTSSQLLKLTSHDYYTYTHCVNVGIYSMLLAKAVFKGTDAHNMQELASGFFLHDIGKVNIDTALINKQGKFTVEEMQLMKLHPEFGYKLLSDTSQLTKECRIIVMHHHERVDGTGYPKGIKDEDIHIYGRICCIADVYDALTSQRSYKQSRNPFEAFKIMKEEMLGHFSMNIFEKFVRLFAPGK